MSKKLEQIKIALGKIENEFDAASYLIGAGLVGMLSTKSFPLFSLFAIFILVGSLWLVKRSSGGSIVYD